ncbi:rhomboid family intramembrane serine protease [Demequina sp. B12]|uniref:rhomboid family intramembrane serine protease n=1 Tax=Demequina sp. B12 TaxID=2992757 RepID=UPI00237A1A90|nr:rhomboid family intramembrane serine protease [Demequina sp. B12]MDE0572103.1 rhomboid family intramembrane serine protease [Demequina sp. B12]
MDCLKEAQAQARPIRSRLGFTMTAGPPIATYVLMGVNIALFVVGPMLIGPAWEGYLGLWPGYTAEFGALYADVGNEWYRWITAGFVQFSWIHLGFNMLALWQLGTVLEPALGRMNFLLLYFGSLLGSSAGVMLLADSGVHGGASGAIFGLIAAYGIILKRLNLPVTQILVIAAIFIGGPMIGLLSGVSWEGHLGGAVVGAAIMLLLFRNVDKREAALRR